MQAEDYLAELRALTPPGRALCAESGTPFGAVLGVTAAELARIDGRAGALGEEADPRTTSEMLGDWERAFGLPDACSGDTPLVATRRAALLSRITERRNPTPATFIALAAAHGVAATITEHRPTTCEMACEAPVNAEEWAHAWTMTSPDRVIIEASCEDTCETPLRIWSVFPHECAVRRAAPAHTVPLFGTYQTEWTFAGGLPAGASLLRGSAATTRDRSARLAEVAAGVARADYDPALTYDEGPNPWCAGAVVGVPGTLPTGWTTTTLAGLAWSVAGTGVSGGREYVDLRLSGTAAATNTVSVRPFGLVNVPALAGETRTGGVIAAVVAGSTSGVDWMRFNMLDVSAGGSIPAQDGAAAPQFMLTGSEQIVTRTRTATHATTAFAGTAFELRFTSGAVVDLTIRFKAPCMNRGSSSLLSTIGEAVLFARQNGVPQYGLRGLLVEAQRWSEGTNARMEGAIAGTPGRLPHGWATAGLNGVAVNVIGTGIEDGATFIDLQVVGTPGASGIAQLFWPAPGDRAATPGEVVSAGHHSRLVGGTLAGVSDMRPAIQQRVAGTAKVPALAVLYGAIYTPTAAALREQPRAQEGAVLSDPAVAAITAGIAWSMTSGVAVNFTLRVGLPLIQPGARLSTPMLQDVGAPGTAPPSLTYVGGKATVWVTTNGIPTVSIPLTDLTGGIASAPAEGDVVVVARVGAGSVGGTPAMSPTTSGYSQVLRIDQQEGGGSDWVHLSVDIKRMGAVPDTDVTEASLGSHGFDTHSLAIHVWRNVDPEAPIEAFQTAYGLVDGDNPNPPSITPANEGAVVLAIGGAADIGSYTATDPVHGFDPPGDLANWVTDAASHWASWKDSAIGMGSVAWTTGAVDPVAWALDSDYVTPNASVLRWGAACVVLRRAGMRGAGVGKTRARDDLRLAVPAGTYEVAATGVTVNPAGTAYAGGVAVADFANGLHFVWPPAAVAAGERHLKTISLRKVI